ncbi:Rqc2 family fibronectin-binding protein [Candidatus Pseudoscillospira sp. SGI.172]|uniref:Rqc2 family fibronectin-binding protein n=1 Tax=Candidatus Pseudoscillospira sp. SGI.172 TaxID=3420582 RepID=UPI003D07F309
MALDAICLSAAVAELRAAVGGGKIDKIYQPGGQDVVLAVRGPAGNVRVLLSANPSHPRLHLTTLDRENPDKPPMFCMLLRKHLTGARILEIEQPYMERIVTLRLEALDELGDRVSRSLVLEAMGRRANLILLDGEGRIMECIRRVDGDLTTGRQVLPGLFYRMPEPRFGVPPLLERELRFRGETGDLASAVEKLWDEVGKKGGKPVMLLREGKPADFSFLPILQYGLETELREYASFGALLDDFYETRERQERTRQRGEDLVRAVKNARDRTARKLENQRRELEATKDRERLRQLGDILTTNLHTLEKGRSTVRLQDYYDPECREVEIMVDPLLTPQQNAARYYKEYNKAKNAESALTRQIERGESDLAYLESVLENLTLAEGERDLQEIRQELTDTGYLRRATKAAKREKRVTGKPMEFRTDSGLRVSVGKNNSQNDQLTMKLASKWDWWFHTQKIHGSHVILWTGGAEPDELSVAQAASLAAWFSQGREAGKVPVDFTPVKYVKKPAGAKPGMVVYTTYQTRMAPPDETLAKRLRTK